VGKDGRSPLLGMRCTARKLGFGAAWTGCHRPPLQNISFRLPMGAFGTPEENENTDPRRHINIWHFDERGSLSMPFVDYLRKPRGALGPLPGGNWGDPFPDMIPLPCRRSTKTVHPDGDALIFQFRLRWGLRRVVHDGDDVGPIVSEWRRPMGRQAAHGFLVHDL